MSMVNKLTEAQEGCIKKVIAMSGVCDDKNNKDTFLNAVSDITAKMSVAVDALITLTDSDKKYFSDANAQNIRAAINDITSAATHILTDAISAVAPEELEKLKATYAFNTAPQINESNKTYDEDILSNLPEAAADIVHLIGINQAMKLFKAFGGTTFPIGKGVRFLGGARAKALQTIITNEEINLLIHHFHGETLYLPRCERLLREVRNRKFLSEFAAMRQDGSSALMTMMLLCPKYGFSDRYGWKLLKDERDSQAEQ